MSKKENNCNVIVTRPTNYMILTCDHSYDLFSWSWHITYPDIKSSLIPISTASFLCHDYIRIFHLSRLHYFYFLVFLSLQHAFFAYCWPWVNAQMSTRKITFRFQLWWREKRLPQLLFMKASRRLFPDQRLFRFQWWWRKRWLPQLLLMKATGGRHSEWRAKWLAGRSISPTLEDVNISFNHPL